MSDATLLLDSLSGLIDRRPPSFDYRTELVLARRTPGSPNKAQMALAAFALDSQRSNRKADLAEALDYEKWLATQPFMQNETLTKEPIYRAGHAYPHQILMGVASDEGNQAAFDAARRLARSHFAWLLLGLAPAPGRTVLDHQPRNAGKGLVLLGDGTPTNSLRYVSQAGMRWWVRDRQNGTSVFMFMEALTPSVIVYQGLDDGSKAWRYPKGQVSAEHAIWTSARKRWPELPPWGLSGDELAVAREFAADPTDRSLVRLIVPWLLVPELPVRFVRFVDASIVSLLCRDGESTTDPVAIDAWYATGSKPGHGGERQIASPCDGIRKEAGHAIAWEEDAAFATQKEGGDRVFRVPKPTAAEAWTVVADGRSVIVEGEDRPAIPGTPPEDRPPAPAPSKPRRRGMGSSL